MVTKKKKRWTPLIFLVVIHLLSVSGCEPQQTAQKNLSKNVKQQSIIQTLKIPCDGPAGSSFYLFKEMDSFDIIRTSKIQCYKSVQILERKCIQNEGSYKGDLIEMNKVKQGLLVGWAQRKDLTCTDIYCDYAPDSICNILFP